MNNETRDPLGTLGDDVHDTIDEAKNRTQAGGERLNRNIQGDDMPIGERIVSTVKEAGHNIAAEFDKAKRDVRHEPSTDEKV